MSIYYLREDITKREAMILYLLLGIGFLYFVYFKQFITPLIPVSFQRFHDIGFLFFWCSFLFLYMLWHLRSSIELHVEQIQLSLISKINGSETARLIIPRNEVISVVPEGINRPTGHMAFFFLHLTTASHPKKSLRMNSHKELHDLVSELNDYQYPFTFLKSLEDYKKEWKADATRFIIIYFSFLALLGFLIYLLLTNK